MGKLGGANGHAAAATNGTTPSPTNGLLGTGGLKKVAPEAAALKDAAAATALPFEPLTYTFKDISYSVPLPKVRGRPNCLVV